MIVVEELCLEQDMMIKEQKTKLDQVLEETSLLKDQLSSGAEGEMKSKISELIEKQKSLLGKLSKANQKEISSIVMEINLGL